MPIYEYECDKCGVHVEALQKFSDQPLTECESCDGKLKKLISQSTFHLKGSGWYVTDYAKSGSQNSTSHEQQKKTSKSEEKPKIEAKSSTENSSKSNSPD